MKGIDISYHQGSINFKEVKKSGIEFVMIRASFGFFNEDKKVHEYVRGCESVNLPYGFYHYSYARNLEEAKREVKGFLNLVKNYNPTFPLVIDMEDADNWKKNNGNPTNEMLIDICDYFCNQVEKAGFYAMIYANTDWFTNRINSSKLDKYDKWLADWRVQPNTSIPRGIHQYTSSGRVSGITSLVDMNIAYQNYPEIIKNMKNKNQETDVSTNNTIYYPSFNNTSIVDGLKSIGINSSFENRKKIAKNNGISNYIGSYEQNVMLLNLARNGKLKQ